MYRTSDTAFTSIYRVTVEFNYQYTSPTTGRRTDHYGHARVNVKASSPTAAREWLLSHPWEAYLPNFTYATILNSYKLRNQPVWLRKAGKRAARFDIRELWLGHIEAGTLGENPASRKREYARHNYRQGR